MEFQEHAQQLAGQLLPKGILVQPLGDWRWSHTGLTDGPTGSDYEHQNRIHPKAIVLYVKVPYVPNTVQDYAAYLHELGHVHGGTTLTRQGVRPTSSEWEAWTWAFQQSVVPVADPEWLTVVRWGLTHPKGHNFSPRSVERFIERLQNAQRLM